MDIYFQDLLQTHLMDTSGHLPLLEFWCSLQEFFPLSCYALRKTTHNSQLTGKGLKKLTKYNAELVLRGVKILNQKPHRNHFVRIYCSATAPLPYVTVKQIIMQQDLIPRSTLYNGI